MTARGNFKVERSSHPAPAAQDDEERRSGEFGEGGSGVVWGAARRARLGDMADGTNAPSSGFAGDFLGKGIPEVPWRGLDQIDWAPLIETQLAHRPFRDFHLCRAARSGAVRHVSLSGVPIFDSKGEFQGYRGVGRDVTREVTAEARAGAAEHELRDKTQLLEATLENMDQGLIVLDAGLRIRAWNDRCVALLELPADAMAVGQPVEYLFRVIGGRGEYGPGDLATIVPTLMERLARCDPPIWERQRPNGKVIAQRRVRMPDGGILVTYTDVTEHKRVEADLRRARDEAELASRSKTEFLANMSHELRTPLNAVIGFSDVLSGELFGQLGDRRYREYARDIRDSGMHLLKLINDVLDVAKIEHGTVEIADELVDVSAVVESCIRLMRERAGAAGGSAPHRHCVAADRSHLRRDERGRGLSPDFGDPSNQPGF